MAGFSMWQRIRRVWQIQRTHWKLAGLDEYTNTPFYRAWGVRVGEGCRIFSKDPYGTFGSEPFLVRLGDHVTITEGVRFITHDGGTWVFRREDPDFDVFGPIEIKDNVFIGINTLIMPGVTVGPNAVVGANSVVSRDVPPDSVAAGVPAKVIMSLEEYRAKKLPQKTVVRGAPPAERRRILSRLWDRGAPPDLD